MNKVDLLDVIEHKPFRQFTLRLTNGASYSVNQPREVGATRDYSVLFYFGEGGGWVIIEPDSIVEVIYSGNGK